MLECLACQPFSWPPDALVGIRTRPRRDHGYSNWPDVLGDWQLDVSYIFD